ncbi:MAG: DUF975 family protein [Longicatena sp.]
MFDRVSFKQKAKEQLQGNWMYFGGITVLFMLFFGVSGVISIYVPFVGFLLAYMITAPLSYSEVFISAKVYNAESVKINDIFSGFKYLVKCLGLTLWISLWIFLWMLPLFIPAFIKSYSYSMAFYCLHNNPDLTIREALKESIRITDGHKMDLFVLSLSWIGWSFVVMLTCGLGVIFLAPYVSVTQYAAYQSLKDESNVCQPD